jgi:hypothetical protein
MRYTCPVCFFTKLPYPPNDYHICPCCGTEFGNDDANFSYEQLREMWIAGGANWFFGRAPEGWNPWLQLIRANYNPYYVRPGLTVNLKTNAIAELSMSNIGQQQPVILSA